MNSDACAHACVHVYINREDANSFAQNSLSTSAPLKTPSQILSPLKFPLPISSQISLLSNSLTPYPLNFSPLKFPFPISSQISLLSNSLSPYPLQFSLLSNSSPHIPSNFSSSQIPKTLILKCFSNYSQKYLFCLPSVCTSNRSYKSR